MKKFDEFEIDLGICSKPQGAILWMDEIRLHHFRTMVETIVSLVLYTGESNHSRVSWVVRIGFRSHPQYQAPAPLNFHLLKPTGTK